MQAQTFHCTSLPCPRDSGALSCPDGVSRWIGVEGQFRGSLGNSTMRTTSNHHSIKTQEICFQQLEKGFHYTIHPPTHPHPVMNPARLVMQITNAIVHHKRPTDQPFKSPHILHIKGPSIRKKEEKRKNFPTRKKRSSLGRKCSS